MGPEFVAVVVTTFESGAWRLPGSGAYGKSVLGWIPASLVAAHGLMSRV